MIRMIRMSRPCLTPKNIRADLYDGEIAYADSALGHFVELPETKKTI